MADRKHNPKAFHSEAHRRALWATDPELARNITSKYGSLIGGGFSEAQLRRRRSAAGRGEPYVPPPVQQPLPTRGSYTSIPIEDFLGFPRRNG